MEAAIDAALGGKTDDPVGFRKTYGKMKTQAVGIGQFAVAGKFPAAFFFCPVFAGCDQQGGISPAAAGRSS